MPRGERVSFGAALALIAGCATPPGAPPRDGAGAPRSTASAAPALPSLGGNALPSTPRRPVTDTYHGVPVRDDYRWLEDSASAEVKGWSAAENAHARRVLDALPRRSAVAARVAAVLGDAHPRYPHLEVGGKRWFLLVDQPPRQQKFLVVSDGERGPEGATTLVDPNALDPSGKTAIDWFRPSPDGEKVAVSLSRGGSELGDVTVVDVKTGQAMGDAIPRVNGGTAGGDLAWAPDGKGFYYTRYPAPGERPPEDLGFYQELFFHELGRPVGADHYELGKDFPKISEIQVSVDARTGRALAAVQKGDGGELSQFLRTPSGRWQRLTEFGDRIAEIQFDPVRDDLWAISRRSSPLGELLRIDGKTLDVARAPSFLAPGSDSLVSDFWGERTLLVTEDHVYATFQLGGPTEIRAFSRARVGGRLRTPLEVASFSGLSRERPGQVLFLGETWLTPAAWYTLDEKTGESARSAFSGETMQDLRAYGVAREYATSKDGTRVPVSIVTPREFHPDGSRACVVTGYGGYGRNIEPRFRPDTGLWVERGVVHAIANLRGGAEYGEGWHRAGNLENKQNVFDDFAAVLEHLIAQKYCAPHRVGIVGGSNGGLLMGATLVQHPELVSAVVSYVGIYDMLRVELSPNGAFNVTEFGTVKDPAQFRALFAYSPYHHVKADVRYPKALLVTGENDPRVDPMQSRKMAAALQASATGSGILLRTSAGTGHGGSTDLAETIAQKTDAIAFMLDALGVTAEPD